MLDANLNRRAAAAQAFHRARRQAALEAIVGRLSGHPTDLLSFDAVVDQLGMRGQSDAGTQQVPLEAIIGSVGRYRDFSRSFMPRVEGDEDRWVSVSTAAPSIADLPAIQLYRINDVYFVLDGNHRVSIARTRGLDYIDAHVTEVHTRAPLPPGASPDGMIIAAEYAAFLAATSLDRHRPELDLTVSVPGQYAHLENHIEAQRYIREALDERDYSIEEAAVFWYDDIYLPLVESIREYGILRYFRGRTETDFFVWLSRHRASLRSELGLDVTPDETVTHLVEAIEVHEPEPASRSARLGRRLQRIVSSVAQPPEPLASWADRKRIDRYSDRLFASILLALHSDRRQEPQTDTVALRQALSLQELEHARLSVVMIGAVRQQVADGSQSAGIEVEEVRGGDEPRIIAHVPHDAAIDHLARAATVHDLVVVDRVLLGALGQRDDTSNWLNSLVQTCRRPVLISGQQAGCLPARRIFLRLIDEPQAEEALFLATYLAESWGASLVIMPTTHRTSTPAVPSNLEAYLSMHEVQFDLMAPGRRIGEDLDSLVKAITASACDFVILVGPHEPREATWIEALSRRLDLPVLLTT